MKATMVLAAASVLALSAGAASAQGTSGKGFDAHATRLTLPDTGLKALYDQNNDDAGMEVISDSEMGSQGADDFLVPSGHVWKIREVDATGVYFDGSGPAASENVFFYKDQGGMPGRLIVSLMNVNGVTNAGSFAIPIPAVKLKAGHYWVSVQANCSLTNGCGEWGWEERSVIANDPAVWESGQGWSALPNDLMFALKGRDRQAE